jgi:hypothetical protein
MVVKGKFVALWNKTDVKQQMINHRFYGSVFCFT